MNSAKSRDMLEGRGEEHRMPKSQDEAGREVGGVLRIGFDDLTHQGEETFWIVIRLDVNL